MSSILQIKKPGTNNEFIEVPYLQGKSAYEHALEGGLPQNINEETFNMILGNLVYGSGADNTIYQINVTGQKPDDNTPENVITIVLES